MFSHFQLSKAKDDNMGQVIISADSTCDIGPQLQEKFNIRLLNWRIELDGKEYLDNVEITPDVLYETWRKKGILPKSCGATPAEYLEYFGPRVEAGYDVVISAWGPVFPALFKTVSQRLRSWDMCIRWTLRTSPRDSVFW